VTTLPESFFTIRADYEYQDKDAGVLQQAKPITLDNLLINYD
jgi:hypothetical protein